MRPFLVPAVILIGLTLALAYAQSPSPQEAPPEERIKAVSLSDVTSPAQRNATKEAAIRRALRTRVTASFAGAPLSEAIAWVEDRAGISIVIEEDELRQDGIELNQPVSFALSNVTAGQLLHRILSARSLAWIIEDEVLHVVPETNERATLTTRTYPVPRLLERFQLERKERDAANSWLPPSFPYASGSFRQSLPSIRSLTSESAWREEGGSGTVSLEFGCLVVRQSRRVHEELTGLLEGLDAFVEKKLDHGMAEIHPDWSPAADATAIRAALMRTVEAQNFADAPLKEAVGWFADFLGINIVIDETALAEDGIKTDQPVTLKLRNVSARSALELLLKRRGLTTLIDQGVLVITTPVRREDSRLLVLYDVRDLFKPNRSSVPLICLIQDQTQGDWMRSGGLALLLDGCLAVRHSQDVQEEVAELLEGLRTSIRAGKIDPILFDPEERTDEDLNSLQVRIYDVRPFAAKEVEPLVREFVRPESWNAKDRAGHIRSAGETLVIRTTARTHRDIERFLTQLKNTAGPQRTGWPNLNAAP